MTNLVDNLYAQHLGICGFTPGPWEVQYVKRGNAKGHWIVTAANGKTKIAGGIANEHDARVIASVPGMLDMVVTAPQPPADAESACPHCGCHLSDDQTGVW